MVSPLRQAILVPSSLVALEHCALLGTPACARLCPLPQPPRRLFMLSDSSVNASYLPTGAHPSSLQCLSSILNFPASLQSFPHALHSHESSFIPHLAASARSSTSTIHCFMIAACVFPA
ncbi:hypothetical protein IE81DRAFT_116978 [Ceraceosorus guamensis]|uniref:Uncharacterized protein n=1 Tax=Ceraceosorus guamensis TaxID=1522189 RepID=A0A316VYD0_9BASI|nr:hypothetical protein IE81DRAFT_116978 [Ceraceosorus guamensis]PWN42636.1 hypothetical protein IE81DRAFT_116978 [Ceraceosorus guamensis]